MVLSHDVFVDDVQFLVLSRKESEVCLVSVLMK